METVQNYVLIRHYVHMLTKPTNKDCL